MSNKIVAMISIRNLIEYFLEKGNFDSVVGRYASLYSSMCLRSDKPKSNISPVQKLRKSY